MLNQSTRSIPLLLFAGAGLLLALTLSRGAEAIPPGGPVTDPGNPPASVRILTPVVPQRGVVRFEGSGWLTNQGQPQRVYLKFDDFGVNGIGPFLADSQGNLTGSVSLDHVEAPPYVNDLGREHWLRFLAGPSGKFPRNGPPRSLTGEFSLVPFGTNPNDPDPGPAPTKKGKITLLKGGLQPYIGSMWLRVKVSSPHAKLRIVARTAGKVRVNPRQGARRQLLFGKATRVARNGRAWNLRIPLTRAGKRFLQNRPASRRKVALKLSLRGAEVKPLTRVVRLKPGS